MKAAQIQVESPQEFKIVLDKNFYIWIFVNTCIGIYSNKIEINESLPTIRLVTPDIIQAELYLTKNTFFALDKWVKSNYSNISNEIKEKIFQPFFTTKPTGSGTVLGLSLSYDIIKAHGGEITVESSKNVGTEFIILIPIT